MSEVDTPVPDLALRASYRRAVLECAVAQDEAHSDDEPSGEVQKGWLSQWLNWAMRDLFGENTGLLFCRSW